MLRYPQRPLRETLRGNKGNYREKISVPLVVRLRLSATSPTGDIAGK
jgi:hypothetical protein